MFKVVKTNWTHNNRPFLDTVILFFFSNSLHTTFHNKRFQVFFGRKKNLGMLMWRVILVILGMFGNFGLDNVNVALLRVKFPLSRLKY